MIKLQRRKDKIGYMNLGKIVFNSFNFGTQVANFYTKNSDSSYLVIGGYPDNSFKIINKSINSNAEPQIKHTVYFHKVQSLSTSKILHV